MESSLHCCHVHLDVLVTSSTNFRKEHARHMPDQKYIMFQTQIILITTIHWGPPISSTVDNHLQLLNLVQYNFLNMAINAINWFRCKEVSGISRLPAWAYVWCRCSWAGWGLSRYKLEEAPLSEFTYLVTRRCCLALLVYWYTRWWWERMRWSCELNMLTCPRRQWLRGILLFPGDGIGCSSWVGFGDNPCGNLKEIKLQLLSFFPRLEIVSKVF